MLTSNDLQRTGGLLRPALMMLRPAFWGSALFRSIARKYALWKTMKQKIHEKEQKTFKSPVYRTHSLLYWVQSKDRSHKGKRQSIYCPAAFLRSLTLIR